MPNYLGALEVRNCTRENVYILIKLYDIQTIPSCHGSYPNRIEVIHVNAATSFNTEYPRLAEIPFPNSGTC